MKYDFDNVVDRHGTNSLKYDFKYRIYLANAEKQQKYKEKRQKKIMKELEKVIKQHQE